MEKCRGEEGRGHTVRAAEAAVGLAGGVIDDGGDRTFPCPYWRRYRGRTEKTYGIKIRNENGIRLGTDKDPSLIRKTGDSKGNSRRRRRYSLGWGK